MAIIKTSKMAVDGWLLPPEKVACAQVPEQNNNQTNY
jgi:hypothetical protein